MKVVDAHRCRCMERVCARMMGLKRGRFALVRHELHSLTESIDMVTSGGRLVLQIFGTAD